jgi:hypothetical protein
MPHANVFLDRLPTRYLRIDDSIAIGIEYGYPAGGEFYQCNLPSPAIVIGVTGF